MSPRQHQSRWLTGGLIFSALAAGILASAIPASAQPDANNPPVGQNPPNWANPANMTPAQRQEMQQRMRQQMQQALDQAVRAALQQSGFTDAGLVDTVLEQSHANAEASIALSEKNTKLMDAVRNKAADADIEGLMADLRAGVKTELERRGKAAQDLDAKIGYSKQPRLEALLTYLGIIGQESAVAGDLGSSMGRLMMGAMFGGFAPGPAPAPPARPQ